MATRFAPRGADTFRLNLTSSGFEIITSGAAGSRTVPVSWTEVSKVDAYQRDSFQKSVTLVLTLKDGSSVELNEFLPGWQDIIDALSQHLPGCLPRSDWWRGSSADTDGGLHWRTIYYRYSISGMGTR